MGGVVTKKESVDDRALRRALEAGDVAKTLELLLATTAAERRALAPFVAERSQALKEQGHPDWSD